MVFEENGGGDGIEERVDRIVTFLEDRIDRLVSMSIRSATSADKTLPIRHLEHNTHTDKESIRKLINQELGLI